MKALEIRASFSITRLKLQSRAKDGHEVVLEETSCTFQLLCESWKQQEICF